MTAPRSPKPRPTACAMLCAGLAVLALTGCEGLAESAPSLSAGAADAGFAAPDLAADLAEDLAAASGSETAAAAGVDAASVPSDDASAPPPEGPNASQDAGERSECGAVTGLLEGDPLVIPTTEGPVVGVLRDGVRTWRGLPYAAPPLAARRFRPPEPPACRGNLHVARDFGPVCPQPGAYAEAAGATEVVGAEDCLTLAIWAPPLDVCRGGDSWTAAAGCPVLVYLHGGGHVGGGASATFSGGGLTADGATLAADHGVIVVTVQSRLGALGYLAHPALVAEQPGGASGNLGLLDQQQALRWVQANIRGFGGNPARVALAGTSAGAVDVAAHLAAPSSAGLFARAVVMSGAAVARDHDAALSEGRHLVGRTPCGAARDGAEVLACLRALPAAELVAATHLPPTFADLGLARAPTYGPTVDGVFLPEAPLALIARRHGSKNVAPPAVLVGSNAEELVGLLPATGLTAERWPEALRAFVAEPLAAATGGDVDAILAELLATYPLTLAASPDAVLAELLGDLRFTCPARRLLAATAGPEARAYRYLFARRVATVYGPLPASHGREVPLFFGSWRNLPGYAPAEEDALLSEAMAEALATFARDGLPAVTGPAWRPYGEEGDTLRWDAPVTVVHDPGAARCGLWERLRGDDDEG